MIKMKFKFRSVIVLIIFILLLSLFEGCNYHRSIDSSSNPAIRKIDADKDLYYFGLDLHPNLNFLAVEGYEKTCRGKCLSKIYVVDLITGEAKKVINVSVLHPKWTPDGLLSFWDGRDTLTSGIYFVDSDYLNPKLLNAGEFVSWSPDGEFLATSYSVINPQTSFWLNYLEIEDLVTQQKKVVFEFPPQAKMDQAWIGEPYWSQNSQKVIFMTWQVLPNEGRNNQLYIYDLVDQKTTLVELGLVGIRNASFLPNNKWIFVTYGLNDQLAFINLESHCVVNSTISEIDYFINSNNGEQIIFSGYSRGLYYLDFRVLLGKNFEKLICDSIIK